MGTPSSSLQTQAKSAFTLHLLATLAGVGCLAIGAFYSSGFSRGFIIAGGVCAVISYFTHS